MSSCPVADLADGATNYLCGVLRLRSPKPRVIQRRFRAICGQPGTPAPGTGALRAPGCRAPIVAMWSAVRKDGLMVERCTVEVVAGHKPSGEPVMEELLVDRLPGDEWRLVATPGLVLGVAAGDIFVLREDGRPHVTVRGGNLAIQVFGPHDEADLLAAEMAVLGGGIDARAPELTVFTVPVSAGFPVWRVY